MDKEEYSEMVRTYPQNKGSLLKVLERDNRVQMRGGRNLLMGKICGTVSGNECGRMV